MTTYKKVLMSGEIAALPPTPDPADVDYSAIAISELNAGTQLRDLQFNNNGSYIVGIQGSTSSSYLKYWPLSTAYDLTTAGTGGTYSFGSFPSRSFRFTDNGTKILIKRYNQAYFRKYNLGTAYNPSTISGYNNFSATASGATYMMGQSQPNYVGHFEIGDSGNRFYFGCNGDVVTMYRVTTSEDPTTGTGDSTRTSNFMALNVGSYSVYNGNTNAYGFKVADINHFWFIGQGDRRTSTFDLASNNELGFVNYSSRKSSTSGIAVSDNSILGGVITNSGYRVYAAANISNTIDGVELSTPYDVTTQGSVNSSPSIGSYEAYISDVYFEPGGNYVQYTGSGSDKIYRHYVSSAYNVSTMSSSPSNFSDSLGTEVRSFDYANNGYKLYVCDNSTDNVKQYNCSSAYNPATASLSTSIDLNTSYFSNWSLYGISVANDGSKFWVHEKGIDMVFGFKMTTAHNVSTAVPDKWHMSDDDVRGLSFNSNGSKFFVNELGTIKQYNLSTSWDISSHTMGSPNASFTTSSAGYGLAFGSNGTKLAYMEGSKIKAANLSTGYDLSTAVTPIPSDALSTGVSVKQIKFNAAGNQLYVLDDSGVFHRWALSTAWDLTTASKGSDTLTANDTDAVQDFHVNPNGTVINWVLNYQASYFVQQRIYSKTMSTANDLSTAGSPSSVTSRGSETYVYSMCVDGDGTYAYHIGGSSENFLRFGNNGTPYLFSGSNTSTLDISNVPIYYPKTVRFNTSGSKVWVHANNTQGLYAFELTSYYDISTGNIDNRTYLDIDDTILEGMKSFDIGDSDTKFFFAQGSVIYVADIT